MLQPLAFTLLLAASGTLFRAVVVLSQMLCPLLLLQYAASTSASPDYPGSCGRCYDIRCITGPVLSE